MIKLGQTWEDLRIILETFEQWGPGYIVDNLKGSTYHMHQLI